MQITLVILVCTIWLCACNIDNKRRSTEYNPEIYFSEKELPIAQAIFDNNKSELKNLLKNNITDINKPGKEGYTYLLYAIKMHYYDIVEILLKNEANPNILSPRTFIPGAGKQSKPNDATCIESVCYNTYDIKYLKLLVKYGADVNDNRTASPLFKSIMGDQRDKIDFLLKNGAKVNIIAKKGTAPILVAASLTRWDLVERFLDLGADPFIEDKGYTLKNRIEYYIGRTEGTPKYREEIRALIKRLQKMGMEFDFSKAKIQMTDEEMRENGYLR